MSTKRLLTRDEFRLGERPQPSRFSAMVGQRYSNLTVGSFRFRPSKSVSHTGQWTAVAICDCGRERVATPADITSGRAKTCGQRGCEHFHAIRRTNGQKAGFTGHGEIYGCRWAAWRLGAERRGIPFDITIEDAWAKFLAQNRCCTLTGLPLTFGTSWDRKFTASLDRIDSNLGYTASNIQWVHKVVNVMKKDMSEETFLFWCRSVVDFARTGLSPDTVEASRHEPAIKSAANWKKGGGLARKTSASCGV